VSTEQKGFTPMTDIDAHIRSLDMIDAESPTAPSDVLAAVAAFNSDLTSNSSRALQQGAALSIPDKLKEWLDKLVEKIREIVSKLSDVVSFSVTVASPFTVSVTITFARSHVG
jgi:hypothetical protein